MRACAFTALWLSFGAANVASAAELPSSWTFEARTTHGEVWVMPMLALYDAPEADLSSFLGVGLNWERKKTRITRTLQSADVPRAAGLALPGAVNGALGLEWQGQFRHGQWGRSAERLRGAIEGKRDLDETLLSIALHNGGEATLFTWTHSLDAYPLSRDTLPGELVNTSWGPVIIDHAEEPYLVTLQVGIALVAADGEVLIRYVDVYETVLSAQSGIDGAGDDLARLMARELTKVWAIDPSFEAAGPLLAQRQ